MDQVQIVGPSGDIADVVDGAVLMDARDEFAAAVEAGDAYSWASDDYDYTAVDTILGVKNTSEEYDLVIKRILVTGDTASEFVVHTSAGVTMTGTALTGVNLNPASGKVAPASAIRDETGNGQAAASYSGRVLSGRIAADAVSDIDDLEIVVPPGWMIGVDLTDEGGACNAVFMGYYRPAA